MSEPTPPPVPTPAKRPWYRRPRWIIAGVITTAIIAAAAGGGAEEKPDTAAAEPAGVESDLTVTNVIDGDTVDLSDGERVRLVGIDAPEKGTPCADKATAALTRLVQDEEVTLDESDEDKDRYGRLLRYVLVDGDDVGGELLSQGLVIPRYNSTDGYGEHPREAEYERLAKPLAASCSPTTTTKARATTTTVDPTTVPPTTAPPTTAAPPPPPPTTAPPTTVAPPPPPPPPPAAVYYDNCSAARAAGAAPIHAGEPGYGSHLDRDGDGVGCES
jgi:micrococcal nuclease